jgi:hypothetical protein
VVLKGAKSDIISDVGLIFLPPLFDICGNPIDFLHGIPSRNQDRESRTDETG